jgi:hypothetical protein
MRKSVAIFILFAFVGPHWSCKYFTEPKPLPDNSAKPPQVIQNAHINFSPDDTLSGEIFIRLYPVASSSNVISAQLIIDTTLITETTAMLYEYFVNTKAFREGIHTLFFVIYESDHNIGLIKLLNCPSSIYTTTLNFKDRPVPRPPENAYGIRQGGHETINWQYPSTEEAFVDYYVIERISGPRFTDTLFSHVHSYVDTVYGNIYKVGAGNTFGVSYTSVLVY